MVGKNSWSACSGIEINNVELRQGVPLEISSPNKKLTFNTSKDIKFFQTNDVVNDSSINYTYTGSVVPSVIGDPFKTPNNNGGENSVIIYNTDGASITYTFPEPINIAAVANQIAGGGYSQYTEFTLTWTDENGNTSTGSGTTNAGYSYQSFPINPPSLVKSFTITADDGSAFTGFYNNNVGVNVGSLTGTQVKVVSTNVANKEIVVDGGDWTTPYNIDQKWSSSKINNNFAGDITSAFNGILSSDANEGRVRPSNGNSFGYTFSGLDSVTSLRIWVYSEGSNASFNVNGTDVTSTVNSADNESWVDFGSTFSELTEITFTSVNGSNFFSIAGVEVNGAILLDPSFEAFR